MTEPLILTSEIPLLEVDLGDHADSLRQLVQQIGPRIVVQLIEEYALLGTGLSPRCPVLVRGIWTL
jgi:hypothetical protein